jgi:hypothetical protein
MYAIGPAKISESVAPAQERKRLPQSVQEDMGLYPMIGTGCQTSEF